MNKLWNQECRRVLRDMKKCIAVIGGNNNECLRAREFNNLMDNDKLAVNPFNGLWLTIGWLECDDCICRCGQFRMEDVYDNLLTMKIKYLKLRWLRGPGRTEKCLLEKFLLRFLAKSQSLEDLHLIEAPRGILLEQGDWLKDDARLPKSRTIKLGHDMDLGKDQFGDHRANFLEIVARAPNLEAVQNRLRLDVLGSLPLEKMHIIKNLEILRFYESLQEAELRLLWDKVRESKLKLHALAIYRFAPLGNITKECYLDGLVSIIRSSSESLRTMEPDCGATSALKAIAYRLPPLSNVMKLKLTISTAADVRVTQQFQRWPLPPIFPNLTTVSISFLTEVHSFYTEGNELFLWTTVTDVEVECEEIRDVNLAELGDVFPNARTLVISPRSNSLDLVKLEQIWSAVGRPWNDLVSRER